LGAAAVAEVCATTAGTEGVCVVAAVAVAVAVAGAGAAGAGAEAVGTADCVAVAVAVAETAGVPGISPRATSTKPAAQARTPANTAGRSRRFLARLDTACPFSVLKVT
jgi:hypothetical protein